VLGETSGVGKANATPMQTAAVNLMMPLPEEKGHGLPVCFGPASDDARTT